MAKSNSNNMRQRKQQRASERAAVDHSNKDEDDKVHKRKSSAARKSKTSGFPAGMKLIVAMLLVLVVFLVLALVIEHGEEEEGSTSRRAKETASHQQSHPHDHDGPLTQVSKNYRVVKTLPHDPKAFTQGLTFRPDNSTILYESTGMYNESVIRVLDLNNNAQILQEIKLDEKYFGEGLSYFEYPPNPNHQHHKGLVHFTWKELTGFVFDVDTLETLQEFAFTTTTNEGWGIIHVPNNPNYDFIVSDGSANLHFWDKDYKECQPPLEVTYLTQDMLNQQMTKPRGMRFLNELEWDPTTNTILANIWYQDYIARINPTTGFIEMLYDFRGLYPYRPPGTDVFNGIALHPVDGQLWVTGKYWHQLYQIELDVDPEAEEAAMPL
ncbi:Glutamine cyclotransferase [Seminavis robusta]|uniref:Glutamine cyclotransferase n=1 Tax=Seminavis robusta TaxID=568900 RepID=A0A9N8EAH6_9STRA|nr:Glutamine cyclotransferase [Seminavis robusta]|eukprot:Sro885_g216060.1 Glutamine cyclotransferase (381) ;mRNA; f:20519-21661